MSSRAKAADKKYPELTGVSEGVLSEDFLVTAAAVNGPFCRATFSDLGWDSDNIPLVYVPFMSLGYSLKKGDKILVKFSQDDTRYPYLWFQDNDKASNPFSVPSTPSPQPPSTGVHVSYPSQSKTDYSFNILGNGLIVASNDAYTCLRFLSSQALYFSSTGMTLYSKGGKIGLEGDEIDIAFGSSILKLKASDGSMRMSSATAELFSVDSSGNLKVAGDVIANALVAPTHLLTHKHPTAAIGAPSPPIPGT